MGLIWVNLLLLRSTIPKDFFAPGWGHLDRWSCDTRDETKIIGGNSCCPRLRLVGYLHPGSNSGDYDIPAPLLSPQNACRALLMVLSLMHL